MHPDAGWLIQLQKTNGIDRVGKKHHLLPRFYMAKFANVDGKVGTIKKSSGETKRNLKPEEILSQKDFYTYLNLELEADGSVEELISQVEALGCEAISRALSIFRQFPLSNDDAWVFSYFAALQVLRGNRMRRTIEILGDFYAKSRLIGITQENAAEYLESLGLESSKEEIRNLLQFKSELPDIFITPSTNEHIQFMLLSLNTWAEKFRSRSISLIKFPKPCLITSDEPLISSINDKYLSGHYGIAEEIFFPLSPSHLLHFGKMGESFSGYFEMNEGFLGARDFNKAMLRNSYEYAIFNPDFHFKGSSYRPPTKPVIEINAEASIVPENFVENSNITRPLSRFRNKKCPAE